MNRSVPTGRALERALASTLEGLLQGVAWLHRWQVVLLDRGSDVGFDVQATVPLPGGGKAVLCVECREELRPSDFRRVADKPCRPEGRPKVLVRVLALPWVSPRLSDLCAQHGWSWFDLAGNHRLDVPRLLRLERTGNEPVHRRPRPTANLSTPEAARVVRVLLLPDCAGKRWTQREMQNECLPAVSLGLVNKVVRHLRDEELVEVGDDGGVHLREPLKLLYAWRDAYRFHRHERRGYFTLLQGHKMRDALTKFGALAGDSAAYAAFSAADFQAPHVRQPRTWIYVREQAIPRFEETLAVKQVDSGENLVMLVPNDDGVFYALDAGSSEVERMRCTNVVQTYVDLFHSGGRGEEAAEALLNQRLKPEWKQRGLSV